MWDTIFTTMIGFGGFWSWKAFSNRNAHQPSRSIYEAAPIGELPGTRAPEHVNTVLGKHWQANLALGLVSLAVGIAGMTSMAIRALDDAPVSREHFIEVMLSVPDRTYDREELSCIFDLYVRSGIDIGSTTEDEMLADLAVAVGQMSQAEIDAFDDCFDDDTTAALRKRVDDLSDAQIREFFIGVLVADPTIETRRPEAECIVGYLEQKGVLRELIAADGVLSPDLDAIVAASEVVCI